MRRTRAGTRARQSADASTLVKMARRLSESGSRIEDQLWQRRLIELINERLARRNDDAIEAALEELASTSQRAYDDLADIGESCAESTLVEADGRPTKSSCSRCRCSRGRAIACRPPPSRPASSRA